MEKLVGEYEFVKSFGVDRYLQLLGTGVILRKVHNLAKPTLTIEPKENLMGAPTWLFALSSVFNEHKLIFKLGEAVSDETFDSRSCETTVTFEPLAGQGILKFSQKVKKEDNCGPDVEMSLQRSDEDEDVVKLTLISAGHECSILFKQKPKI